MNKFSFQKDGLFSQIFRRLLVAVILFTLVEVVFVLSMYINNVADLDQRLLSRQAQEISHAIRYQQSQLIYDKSRIIREHAHNAKLAFAVYDKNGQEILINGPYDMRPTLMPPITSVSQETRRDDFSNGFRLRGIRKLDVDGQSIWVSLVIEGEGFKPFFPVLLNEVIDHVAIPLIPLSSLLLFFNIVAVRRTLRPLASALEQINSINPKEIDYRLEVPSSPTEVKDLVTAMNGALGRIESAIRSLREFTADTAHELRTPLAIMTMEVDKLPDESSRIKLKKDLDGMTRLVTQMLDMAYADALIIPDSSKANLVEVASGVISQITPLAIKSNKGIILQAEGVVEINGHAEALGRALRNIIENALAHTPENSNVEVSVLSSGVISVRDFGAGIPVDKREESLNRFWRGARKKTNGAGLGLAIARRIAESHGGKIILGEAPDGGALVTVDLSKSISV